MKTIFDGQEKPKNERVDMGAMPISNCKYDCTKCLLRGEGCKFLVNTLNCMVAQKRLQKLLAEEQDKEPEDNERDEDEKQTVKEFLDSISVTEDEEDEE
jgi:hypothetical protein